MRGAVVAAGLLFAQAALACGYCVEDKIAAAYDHAVIARAVDVRHKVAFLSMEGALAKSQERVLARAVESTAGVDRGTVRISVEGGALSFAFDPSRHTLNSIVEGIQKRVAAKGADISVLRVVGD